MIANWTQDGTKAMIYINPYFANLTDASITRNLFLEGDNLGYFIKNKQGTTYLIKSVSIQFAMIDLTNPQARTWMKSIIKDNLITEGQSYGWMHDFGEYTPFDIQLFNGMDPVEFHNQFPYEWAKINREAEQEAGAIGSQIVAFMRSGSTLSPKYCDLFWMGD
jgi:alpha-glucosidase